MSATIFNTDNLTCQGFVYKWTYTPTGQYYIGICKGKPEGKYIGSGKRFLNKWNATERSDWQREILYNGEYEQCPAIEGKLVSDETLRDPFCLPKSVVFKDELPKTAVGKILRRELRDLD